LDFWLDAVDVERQIRAFAPGAWFELEGERYRVLAGEVVPNHRHPREGGDPSPDGAKLINSEMGSRLRGNDEAGVVLDDNLTIACATGAIRPTLIQRAGRPVMDTQSLLNGRAIAAGTKLN
jgi:methionyl-tRNA formyltransferase